MAVSIGDLGFGFMLGGGYEYNPRGGEPLMGTDFLGRRPLQPPSSEESHTWRRRAQDLIKRRNLINDDIPPPVPMEEFSIVGRGTQFPQGDINLGVARVRQLLREQAVAKEMIRPTGGGAAATAAAVNTAQEAASVAPSESVSEIESKIATMEASGDVGAAAASKPLMDSVVEGIYTKGTAGTMAAAKYLGAGIWSGAKWMGSGVWDRTKSMWSPIPADMATKRLALEATDSAQNNTLLAINKGKNKGVTPKAKELAADPNYQGKSPAAGTNPKVNQQIMRKGYLINKDGDVMTDMNGNPIDLDSIQLRRAGHRDIPGRVIQRFASKGEFKKKYSKDPRWKANFRGDWRPPDSIASPASSSFHTAREPYEPSFHTAREPYVRPMANVADAAPNAAKAAAMRIAPSSEMAAAGGFMLPFLLMQMLGGAQGESQQESSLQQQRELFFMQQQQQMFNQAQSSSEQYARNLPGGGVTSPGFLESILVAGRQRDASQSDIHKALANSFVMANPSYR